MVGDVVSLIVTKSFPFNSSKRFLFPAETKVRPGTYIEWYGPAGGDESVDLHLPGSISQSYGIGEPFAVPGAHYSLFRVTDHDNALHLEMLELQR